MSSSEGLLYVVLVGVLLMVVEIALPHLRPVMRWRLWRRIRADRKRRRRLVTDWCEVCNCELTAETVCELREDATDDAALDIGGVGGTYMVATYCRRHFPR